MDENYKEEEVVDKTQRINKIIEGVHNEEDIEEEILEKEVCLPDFEENVISWFVNENNVLENLSKNFGDTLPIFSQNCMRSFVTYFEKKKKNYREIFSLFLISNQENVNEMAKLGIIGRTLISDCPDSLCRPWVTPGAASST